MALTLANIIDDAMSKAGIKRLVGSGTSTDQNTLMLRAANRILESFSIEGHNIFATSVNEYSLVADQIVYTIGPGGDFAGVRPLWIKNANLVQPGSPPVYSQISLYDSRDWSFEQVLAMPGSWIYAIWYNPTFPHSGSATDGCGEIRVLGQPPSTYKLQLYTWDRFETNFSSVGNSFIFPPGYSAALVDLLALECEQLYPHEAKISQHLRDSCAAHILNVQVLNSTLPRLGNDAGRLGQASVPYPASFWNAN